ncbi:MAG: patatin-like phospholipase family protein [Beijerinckiaceae bacterium]
MAKRPAPPSGGTKKISAAAKAPTKANAKPASSLKPVASPKSASAPLPPGTFPGSAGTPKKPDTGPLQTRVFGHSIHMIPKGEPLRLKRTYRILSIDGGGARGMIPAVILKEMERRSGKRIHEMFDRICGTSTGSILTCGLTVPKERGSTRPRYHAKDIVEIYRTLGEVVFSRGSFQDRTVGKLEEIKRLTNTGNALLGVALPPSFIDNVVKIGRIAGEIIHDLTHPLHSITKLSGELYRKLGDTRLEEALCEAFVYAYDIGSRTVEILGSRSSSIPGTRNYRNFQMWQAATASSAAVPFFAPYTVFRNPALPVEMPPPAGLLVTNTGTGDNYQLVDGGNAGVGNPTILAYLDENDTSRGQDKFVLSLGTGHFSAPVASKVKSGGFIDWIVDGGELLNSIFDGASDATDMALRSLAGDKLAYFRWQPSIPQTLAFLDEGSREDMGALEDMAQGFIAEHDEEIDEVVELLKQPRFTDIAA